MCTGSSAAVRDVTAAAAAAGSMFSVTGSMSANTGRARSYSTALAEATKLNGLVTTSSPSPTPTARSARCNPAVPLETALAQRAPRRSGGARMLRAAGLHPVLERVDQRLPGGADEVLRDADRAPGVVPIGRVD